MRLPLFVTLLLFLTAGCYTSQVAPDTVEKANRHLDEVERSGTPQTSKEEDDRLARLFADRPEYATLTGREDAATRVIPRLRTSVPPTYPLGAYVTNAKALVKVAFVISEDGHVEEARIYEASDDRFSAPALEAVRAWTFHPGQVEGRPAKFLFVVPVQFDGRR